MTHYLKFANYDSVLFFFCVHRGFDLLEKKRFHAGYAKDAKQSLRTRSKPKICGGTIGLGHYLKSIIVLINVLL